MRTAKRTAGGFNAFGQPKQNSYNADLMVGFFLLLVTGALNSHIARKYVTPYAFIQGVLCTQDYTDAPVR